MGNIRHRLVGIGQIGGEKKEHKVTHDEIRENVTGRSKADEEFLEKYREVKEKVQAFKHTEDRLRELENIVKGLRTEFDSAKGGPKMIEEDLKRIDALRGEISDSLVKIETNELKINQFRGQLDHVTNEF